MTWDQPHWSGRPQTAEPPRPKLRPNAFARLARFAALRAASILLLAGLIGLVCGGFAVSRLSDNQDQLPVIVLDAKVAERQSDLERMFPGIEQTFLAIVTSGDPETARQQAVALARALDGNRSLFLSAFVPGTGEFYQRNAFLYRDVTEVGAWVGVLLQLEPLYHALAAAPDLPGLTALVAEIASAVEQGRSPPGLATVMNAVSATIEAQLKGKARPVRWSALAGMDDQAQARHWYVLATPRPGKEREAAVSARKVSAGMQGVDWVWPRQALASVISPLRDVVVPALLALLLAFVILVTGLASFRQAAAIMICAMISLAVSGVVAVLAGWPLEGLAWPFALAMLATVLVPGAAVATAYGYERMRGLSSMQAVMMAAQRQGGFVLASVILFAVTWASWLISQLPSFNHFAVFGILGCAVTVPILLVVLPAGLQMFASRSAEVPLYWLTEQQQEEVYLQSQRDPHVVAIVLALAALVSLIFLPGLRFGDTQQPSAPPLLLETPDARGAVHILATEDQVPGLVTRISTIPEVGAIRTAAQFLPPNAPRNIAELQRLAAFTPFVAAPRGTIDDGDRRESLVELQEHLSAIADAPASSPELRNASARLRRAVSLFISQGTSTESAITDLESNLFKDLGSVSKLAARLSSLSQPRIDDLEPHLLRRFVSEQGVWRIEVMPRDGVGELSFAAAVRRTVPDAIGQPIVSLVRNEVMHHETGIVFAVALLAALTVVLVSLRSIVGLIVALAPAGAFLTLTAAALTYLDIRLNSAMLVSASIAMAVVIVCSMLSARRLAGAGALIDPRLIPGRAVLMSTIGLAVSVSSLSVSSLTSTIEFGTVSAQFMLTAALLAAVLAPGVARWLAVFGSYWRWSGKSG